MSFSDLRKECRHLGLSPIGGRYVSKEFLLYRLACHYGTAELSSAEKKVYEHDETLYFTLWPHIHRMPDMRPLETVKNMKQEKQDNWALIAHELEALSYDEKSSTLIQILNGGTSEDLFPYCDYLSDFFFSYPGILWILGEIKPYSEALSAFFIRFSRHLEDVNLLPTMLDFIRERKTAKILNERFPSLSLPKNIWENIKSPGYILWCLEDNRIDLHKMLPSLSYSILNYTKEKEKIVKEILEDGRFLVSSHELQMAAIKKNPSLFSLVLSYTKEDVNKNKLLVTIAGCTSAKIIQILLKDPSVDPSFNRNAAIRRAIMKENTEVVSALLADPRVDPSDMNHTAFIEAAIRGYVEITRLLLAHPKVNPSFCDNYALKEARRRGHLEIVRLLSILN